MVTMPALLDDEQISLVLRSDLPRWTREGDALVRSVTSPRFADGIRLVDKVAVVADERDHHPDIDIRWTTVTFRLSTHWRGGITEADVALAAEIDKLVAD